MKATDQPAQVRWAMVTPADVVIESDTQALLKQKGKTMRLTILGDAKAKLKTYSTAPKADYDAPNPGTRLIGFEVTLSPNQSQRTAVLLTPPAARPESVTSLDPLPDWSALE